MGVQPETRIGNAALAAGPARNASPARCRRVTCAVSADGTGDEVMSVSWRPCEIKPGDISAPPGLEGLRDYLSDTAETDRLLIAKKALVFRGFGISRKELQSVLDLLLRDRLAYVHGNSPRTKVGDNIYTSTEYPPEFVISMHNELSYAARWPARLLFYCEMAAAAGGATPVVDGTRWLDLLDAEVRDAFSGGIRYSQNLPDGHGLGRSWQDTFETDDPGEVEAYLSGAGATWEWTKSGLRVHQVRPATARHPVTGAEVWFNQADQWHPATLGDELAAALAATVPEDDLPQSVRFADGTPIPDRYVLHIRDRGLEAAVDVDWQPGDLLLIDNVLVAHGRRAFTGSRRVLVAMSD
jgi:alpha-ketoglutarate-dependent taurine dioxygenase